MENNKINKNNKKLVFVKIPQVKYINKWVFYKWYIKSFDKKMSQDNK